MVNPLHLLTNPRCLILFARQIMLLLPCTYVQDLLCCTSMPASLLPHQKEKKTCEIPKSCRTPGISSFFPVFFFVWHPPGNRALRQAHTGHVSGAVRLARILRVLRTARMARLSLGRELGIQRIQGISWLVVWLPFFFPYIGFLIIPIDVHIFQRGSNHQPVSLWQIDLIWWLNGD